jgi:hypothetical protein
MHPIAVAEHPLAPFNWAPYMQTKILQTTLVGLSGLLLSVAAQAARPLATDDTGVLDRGDCELEAVLSRDKAAGVKVDGTSLQLGCGVGAGVQLALGVDRAKEAGFRLRGTSLSGKLSLLPGDAASWSASASVLWIDGPGQGTEHAATAVNLLHTRSLSDQFSLHANLGHLHDALARRGSTTWGVALEHAGWGPVALMGEFIGDDLSAPAWNLGLRWTAVPDRLVLDLAYGQQMITGRPKALSLGVKLSF